ncbi:MAG: polysaccharide biosynthesis C-terminal domain-containing protein, partial [Bacteroidales bacterium]
LAVFAQIGTPNSGIKFFPYFKSTQGDVRHNGFFFYMVALPVLGILVFFTLYILLKYPISAYFAKNSALFVEYYYYILPLAFFMIYQGVFETYSNVLMRIVVPKFVREVLVRVLLILAILLYYLQIINLTGFIMAYVIIYGIAALVNLFYVARIGSISLKHNFKYVDPPLRRQIGSYTLFFVFASLGSLVVSKIDVFMLSSQVGLTATGIYSIAFFMSAIIEIPARSVSAIAQPIVSDAYKNGDLLTVDRYFKRVSLNQFLIGSMLFVLLWANIHNIFAIMPNGDVYDAGIWVVFFIALSKTCNQLVSFSSILLMVSKYYRYYLVFVLGLSILTVFANNWLIPIWGMTGAAVASFAALFIHDYGMLLFVSLKLKVHPFSWNIAKVVGVSMVLLLINYFWMDLKNPILDGICRSAVLTSIAFIIIYKFKISDELNGMVNRMLDWGRKFLGF